MIIQHDETGFITHICSEPGNPESLERILEPDNSLRISDDTVVDHWTHYVHNPSDPKGEREVVEMEKISIEGPIEIRANGKDVFEITGLLNPCVIILDGERHEIEDRKLEFSTDEPGTYVFESTFPYLPWKCSVVAK